MLNRRDLLKGGTAAGLTRTLGGSRSSQPELQGVEIAAAGCPCLVS